jgi:aminoglycoside phosphotransferase (APT) family kinase protein
MTSGAIARLDARRLSRWLADRLPVGDGVVTPERMSIGYANEMFRLRAGEHVWVLRMPPSARTSATAHDVAREFRVLSALAGTDVPHPAPLALCEDAEVLGAPFMVMAWVAGFTGRLPLPAAYADDPERRGELALAMVDALAAIGDVDWRGAGLEGFGRPEGFLERQVPRWLGQLDGYRTRELPHLDDVAAWLVAERPTRSDTALIHGDFHWENVIFRPGPDAEVGAVVDWEQSTIGDPLLDLGWLLALWDEPGDEVVSADPARGLSLLPGMPTRAELVERYARRSGRSTRDVDYYRVLALFKLACVLEGVYAHHVNGRGTDPRVDRFRKRVPALLAKAYATTRA